MPELLGDDVAEGFATTTGAGVGVTTTGGTSAAEKAGTSAVPPPFVAGGAGGRTGTTPDFVPVGRGTTGVAAGELASGAAGT